MLGIPKYPLLIGHVVFFDPNISVRTFFKICRNFRFFGYLLFLKALRIIAALKCKIKYYTFRGVHNYYISIVRLKNITLNIEYLANL
jgi:hypothetical protein